MSMLLACILNPEARDGRSKKKYPLIFQELENAGFTTELHFTTHSGHAVEIAFGLRERGDIHMVVAIGGDGTVHEVASGLRMSRMRLGIIPLGSGDDLARGLGIPRKDIRAAVAIIKNGTDHLVGAVRVEGPPADSLDSPDKPPPVHICNGSPRVEGNIVKWSFLETDAGVTSSVNRMKSQGVFTWIPGNLKYQMLGVRAIFGWKPQKAWFQLNGGAAAIVDLQGLFVVQMCETFGGGFRGAPGMHPKKPHATITTALGLSKMQMLRLMGPLKQGTHVGKFGEEKITQQACQTFSIGACDAEGNISPTHRHNPPLFVTVDGECAMQTPASFEFHAEQLTMRGASQLPNELLALP